MTAKHLKQILDEYLTGDGFEEINNTISIQSAWEKVVGKLINKNTEIKSFKNQTIIIKTSNPIWCNELSLQKQIFIEKLQKAEPGLNINKIIFK